MAGRWLVAASGVLVALSPSVAQAELVTVRGGRVLSVKAVRFEGDEAILSLRSGGEMRTPRDYVQAVAPDEAPYPEPVVEPVAVSVEPVEVTVVTEHSDLVALIDERAAHHGVNAKLAQALIKVESNYKPNAVSPKGAMGLMQLMPATARQYSLEDPFDARQNLDAGLRHLRGLLDRYGKGKESLALAAYNAGEGAVSKFGGIPPYRETQDYVRRILTLTGR